VRVSEEERYQSIRLIFVGFECDINSPGGERVVYPHRDFAGVAWLMHLSGVKQPCCLLAAPGAAVLTQRAQKPTYAWKAIIKNARRSLKSSTVNDSYFSKHEFDIAVL